MAKIVLFVDALDERDLSGRLSETFTGSIESGAPKVTPKVTGEVYTGHSPSQQGMGRVHAHGGEMPKRPHAPMIMEKLEAAGYNVASFFMPYATPTKLQNGMWSAEGLGDMQVGHNQLAQLVQQPPASGDLMDQKGGGAFAFNSRLDEWYGRVSSVLNAIRVADIDVMFIGIRSPDQYTHFQQQSGYREKLIEDIAHEVRRMEANHDVLWWSDHGSEEKKETFRVNRWLIEKGYLDVEIDLDFHERFSDEMGSMNPRAQQQLDIPNQLGTHSPGVELKGGHIISGDPYDGSLNVLPGADETEAANALSELRDTGYYDYLVPTVEEWGDGKYIDECPDYVGLRADNVLITGNVHPEPIGLGFLRDGVHSRRGVYGSTTGLDVGESVTPRAFHDAIWEFVTGKNPALEEVSAEVNKIEQQLNAALGD